MDEPRTNPLAVGSAPQADLTTATARELFDMANRFFQHQVLGRPDTNQEAREKNLGTPTTISRELYDAREAARNRPSPMSERDQSLTEIARPHPAVRPQPTQREPQLMDLARQHIGGNEGFRDAAYPDPVRGERTPTIGFGTTRNGMIDDYLESQNLNPDEVFRIGSGVRITRDQAADMRDLYMNRSFNALNERADTRWFAGLPIEAQVVLMDMTFNMGSHFRFPNMFRALERGDYNAAADEILTTNGQPSRYATQVGNRAVRNANLLRSLAEPQQ